MGFIGRGAACLQLAAVRYRIAPMQTAIISNIGNKQKEQLNLTWT
jgi:hypothetical protein